MKLLLIFLFTFTAMCQANDSAAMPQIRICFERWWPYSFVDDNKLPTGIEVEIIKTALGNSPYALSFYERPYRRCLSGVQNNEFDFTLHVDKSDDLPTVSVSFTTWQLAFAVKRGRFKTLGEIIRLQSPKLMISEEYTYPDVVVKKLNKLKFLLIKRSYYEENHGDGIKFFSVLDNHRVDAILVDKIWASEMIRSHQLNVELLSTPLHSEKQYMGFKKGREDFVVPIEQYLKTVKPETIQQIHKQFEL
ncbi:substrate-binding periplasmic protein (plasmid) [Pseudoalteromonas sp. T1lg65]|uniref:substrate-binding periplasmic protein n=1 Tax=Pseudoalteromonas sp. T1lg65 TaxID=2077101 RepID=UPI003F7A1A57